MDKNQIIKITIDEVLATRDFCGDEKQAIKQVQDDFDITFTENDISKIHNEVQKKWSKFQDEAGVPVEKRLTDFERQKIMNDDEDEGFSPR